MTRRLFPLPPLTPGPKPGPRETAIRAHYAAGHDGQWGACTRPVCVEARVKCLALPKPGGKLFSQ